MENEDTDIHHIVSKIRLKENDKTGEFRPFVVDYKSNPTLRSIVKAFANSSNIKLGYSTIVKGKGIQEPTMKRKSLYLTGGSLRDHLKNQTLVEYDCATDASPDEIRMILSTPFADLKEVKPKTDDIEILSKYKSFPDMDGKKRVFYVSRWDAENKEMEFTVEIDGQKCFISTFNLNPKNRMLTPKRRHFATTPEEDARSRDLTINSLYLNLKNDEGENSEILDPNGGAFDLKNGKIVLVSEKEAPFEKDPYLPYRIAYTSARYAADKKIPPSILVKIRDYTHGQNEDKMSLKRYYIAAIENINVPTDAYIDNLINSHLVKRIFPDLIITHPISDLPNNKILATAFILQDNVGSKIAEVLEMRGWSKHDVENIVKFAKLARFCKNKYVNPLLIYDFFNKPNSMPNSYIKQFLQLLGCEELYDLVFMQDMSHIMKKYVDEDGVRKVNHLYSSVLGRAPRPDEMEEVRKKLFSHEIKNILASANK